MWSFQSMVGFSLLVFCCRFLHLCSSVILVYNLFVTSLSSFGVKMMVASQNEFGSVPFSEIIFWNSFWRMNVILFLNIRLNSPMKSSVPGFLLGVFKLLIKIQVIDVFIFSISSLLSLQSVRFKYPSISFALPILLAHSCS